MNINDLPQGSYTAVAPQQGGLNIRNLPQGSYQPYTPSFLDQLGEAAKAIGNFAAPIVGDVYNDVTGQNQKTALQQLGDLGSTALTAAAFVPGLSPEALAAKAGLVGAEGLGLGGRLAAQGALGAGFGLTGALGAGQTDPGAIAQNTLGGAVAGGVLGGAGEGVSKVVGSLPTKIAQRFAGNVDPETAQAFLKNYTGNSYDALASQNKDFINSLGRQVTSIVQSPEYSFERVQGDVFKNVADQFPSSNLTPNDVADITRGLVKLQGGTIDALQKPGGISLEDANVLRKALSPKIRQVFSDLPDVAENKKVGAAVYQELSSRIKTTAPETIPLFQKLGQHLEIKPFLKRKATQEQGGAGVNLFDIAGGIAGGTLGGIPGAIAGVAAERALKNPGVNLTAARGLQGFSNFLNRPGIQQGGLVAKSALLRALLSQGNQGNQIPTTAIPSQIPQ